MLVGITRRATVQRYLDLFLAAGIKVVNFTFSAAAVHSAVRLNGAGLSQGFIALGPSAGGGVEVYGESQARPVFTAEFQLPPERAASLGLARITIGPRNRSFEAGGRASQAGRQSSGKRSCTEPAAICHALAGACPWVAPAANLQAPEQRQASSRAVFIPSAALAIILLLVAGAILFYRSYADRKYLEIH
ncbi:MAG: hypothetical protein WDO73_33325 [Ignavibacteriota bacterium]